MLGAFLKAGFNEFEISIKFCVFFIPILTFLGHNSTFCILLMQMGKKLYIFKHFAKSKKLFFGNIYQSPFDSHWNSPKSIKLKPPTLTLNYANFEYFRFCAFFHGFLLLTFVRGSSESRHQRIWNQHKILCFFDTYFDIFGS